MDAKFRNEWRNDEPESVLKQLLLEKNYNQEGDRVFILQPAAHTITHVTSPLNWGRDCNFGQDPDNNHSNGFIYFATDFNMQILAQIYDGLSDCSSKQYVQYRNSTANLKNGVAKVFASAAKRHKSNDITERQTKKGHPYWILICSACQLKTTRHCFGQDCGTELFKNGILFTYHRTLADHITNVVCPKCGEHFDIDLRQC